MLSPKATRSAPPLVSTLWAASLLACLPLASLSAQENVEEAPTASEGLPDVDVETGEFLESPLPTEGGGAEGSDGFFPTLSEIPLLRGPYDARSMGGTAMGTAPDRRTQLATDIFPYSSPDQNFYQRNPQIFRRADQILGFFTPFDTLTYENDRIRNFAMSFDSSLGILNRNFSPELATFKMGPLFLDVLWVGTGLIWSEYNGPQQFVEGEEDGFTGFVEVGVRAAARLTDTIFLIAGANIMYLPFNDRWAFQSLTGLGPGASLSMVYADDWEEWDVSFYNYFTGSSGINFLGQISEPGFDRAGRYAFGTGFQNRTNDFYSEDNVFWNNRLGGSANRLVFDNEWRLNLIAEHTDFWRSFDFDDHRVRDMASISLGYEGSVIPFAPEFFYTVFEPDGLGRDLEIFFQQLGASFTGRLTENVNWQGNAGYIFLTGPDAQTDNNSFLWTMGLEHTVNINFQHWLRFGQGFFSNEFFNEYVLSRFVSYGFNQRLDRRTSLTGFVQYADSELDLITDELRQTIIGGASLNFQPLDFTRFSASVIYNHNRVEASDVDSDRWIYRASLTQQLALRLTGTLFYQFEDFSGQPSDFDEHLIGFNLRRYF
jgi:hypothetical protein